MVIEQVLFQYESAPPWAKPQLEDVVFHAIIAFRAAKDVAEDERQRLSQRIAAYNNRLVKQKARRN